MEILIVVGACFIAILIIAAINMSVQRSSLTDAVRALPDFVGAEVLVRGTFGVACNVNAGKYALAWGSAEAPRVKVIPASALISVEIECVGEVTKTKASGFGKSITTSAGAKEINLCLKFRDTELPVVRFPLFIRVGNSDFGEQTGMSEARKWESAILAVAHSVNPPAQLSRDIPVSQPIINSPGTSLAQEIANLRQLMAEGTLSETEFEQAKAKALSR